jgi:hypothetical protein
MIGRRPVTTSAICERIRALSTGITFLWNRIGTILGPPLIGYVLQTDGLNADFLMLGSLALVGAVLMLLFGVETRRRVLDDLSPVIRSSYSTTLRNYVCFINIFKRTWFSESQPTGSPAVAEDGVASAPEYFATGDQQQPAP